jgi:hypothetical protein
MKKTIFFILVFCFLALIIPGSPLFADTGLGGRFDAGLNFVALLPLMTANSQTNDSISLLPVIPLNDLAFYVKFNTGIFNTGIGLRGLSFLYINVFWPSLYAELNLWRFSLDAQIGGGALYVFPIFFLTGPYFVPELSLWFNFITYNRADRLSVGFGSLAIVSPDTAKNKSDYDSYVRYFTNNAVVYLAIKATFDYRWKTF